MQSEAVTEVETTTDVMDEMVKKFRMSGRRGAVECSAMNATRQCLCSSKEELATDACDKESVEAPRLWQKMATQILADVEEEWMKKRMGVLLDLEFERTHRICSFMSRSEENLEQMLRDLIEEANRWDLVPKPTSLWWTSTYHSEEKVDMILGTTSGCYKFPFEEKSNSWATP